MIAVLLEKMDSVPEGSDSWKDKLDVVSPKTETLDLLSVSE